MPPAKKKKPTKQKEERIIYHNDNSHWKTIVAKSIAPALGFTALLAAGVLYTKAGYRPGRYGIPELSPTDQAIVDQALHGNHFLIQTQRLLDTGGPQPMELEFIGQGIHAKQKHKHRVRR